MRILIILLGGLCLPLLLPAQLELDRQILVNAGEVATTSPFELSHSFGQPFAGFLKVGNASQNQALNLGFQQSDLVWPVSIAEDRLSDLKLYPNPTTGIQSLEFDLILAQDLSIRLSDINGRHLKTVFEGALPAGNQLLTIDSGQLPAGIYFLEIRNPSGIMLGKFILSRR